MINIKNQGFVNNNKIGFAIFAAFLLWFISFGLRWFNFWFSLPLSVCFLTLLAWYWGRPLFSSSDMFNKNIFWGLSSAAFLYIAFALGNFLSSLLFDFAPSQIQGIYSMQEQAPIAVITLLLVFVTSPGEEIFWRGFVQRNLMTKLGNVWGWLLTSAIYSAVHISSLNFMLVMAALVAGLTWGFVFMYKKSLMAVIISHIVWTIAIFILAPIA